MLYWAIFQKVKLNIWLKNNVVNGLKFSYDQIKHLKLGLCPTCLLTKMKAFPIYKSLSETQYGVFECVSFDIVDLGYHTLSIDGYRYAALYVDHCTHKLMAYGMKHKSDLLSTLQQLIHQYGPTRNSKSLRLTYLILIVILVMNNLRRSSCVIVASTISIY